jgi:hypothetical protein
MATVTFSEKFNNAVSYLNGAITNVATTINVDSATALGLDNSTTSAYLTIISASSYRKSPLTSPETSEIIHVTAVSTNALTVTRGADNTTGLAFDDNDIIEMRNNVANIEDIQDAITDSTATLDVEGFSDWIKVGDRGNSGVTAASAAIVIDDNVGSSIAILVDTGKNKNVVFQTPGLSNAAGFNYAEASGLFTHEARKTGGEIRYRVNGTDEAMRLHADKRCELFGDLDVSTKTPSSAGATGTTGTITWDASYIYVCTATNTWKRVAIATW